MKNQQIFLLKLGVQLVTILVLVSFSFAGTNLSAKLQNKKKIVIQKTVKKQQARTCDAKQSPKKMPKKVTRPRKKTEPRVPKKPTNKKVVNQAKPPERKMTNQSNKNNKKVTSGKRKTNRKVDNKRKGSTPKINAQQKKRNPMINNRGGKNNPGIVIDEMKNDRKGVKQKKRNSHKSVNPDKRTSPKIDDRSSKPVRIIASGMNKNTKHGRKGRAKPVSRNIKKEVPSKASEKEFRIDQHYSSKPNKPGRNEVVDSLYRKNKSEDKTALRINAVRSTATTEANDIKVRIIRGIVNEKVPQQNSDEAINTNPNNKQDLSDGKYNGLQKEAINQTSNGEEESGSYGNEGIGAEKAQKKRSLDETIKETFGIPDDVPVEASAEVIDFAAKIALLGGESTPELWRVREKEGEDEAIKSILSDIYHVPDDEDVGTPQDILDFVSKSAMLGGEVTAQTWKKVASAGAEETLRGMAIETFGLPDDTNHSLEDILNGVADGQKVGVSEKELPEFLENWQRVQEGGLSAEELIEIWVPGAKPGNGEGVVPRLGDNDNQGHPNGTSREPGGGGKPGGNGNTDGNGIGGSENSPSGHGGGALRPDSGNGNGGVSPGGTGVDTESVNNRNEGGSQLPQTGDLDGHETGSGTGVQGTPGTGGNNSPGSVTGSDGPLPGSDPGGAPAGGQEGDFTGAFARFSSDGQGGYYMDVYGVREDGTTEHLGTEHFSSNGDGTFASDTSGDVLYNEPDEDSTYFSETDEDGNQSLVGYADEDDSTGSDNDEGQDSGSGSDNDTSGYSGNNGSDVNDSGDDDSNDSGGDDDTDDTGDSSDDSSTDSGGDEGTSEAGGTDDSAGDDDAGKPNPDDDGGGERHLTLEEIQELARDNSSRTLVGQPAPDGGSGHAHAIPNLDEFDPWEYIKNKQDPLIHTTGDEADPDADLPVDVDFEEDPTPPSFSCSTSARRGRPTRTRA